MKNRYVAVHEAAHAVMARIGGMKVEKISIGHGLGTLSLDMGDAPAGNYVMALVAGFMAEFMTIGDHQFWQNHPKNSMKGCSDITTLKAFNLPRIGSKDEIRKMLHGFEKFLSDPPLFGKIQALADELLDHPEGLEGEVKIRFTIAGCQRNRIPEHRAAPLINFLVDELYG